MGVSASVPMQLTAVGALDCCSTCHVFDTCGSVGAAEARTAELEHERPICVLCLKEVRAGDLTRTLPCSHVLHCGCVDSWLAGFHLTCPLCRVDVERPP